MKSDTPVGLIIAAVNDSTGVVLAGILIPSDPKPFNEMAQLFGSAGTALQIGQPGPYFTVDDLASRVSRLFPHYSVEYQTKIVELVVAYWSSRPDRSTWEAACKAKTLLEESGQAGQPYAIESVCAQVAGETGVEKQAIMDMVRSRFYPNQY